MTVTATDGLQEHQCQNSPAKQVSLHLNSNVATGLTITEIAKRQDVLVSMNEASTVTTAATVVRHKQKVRASSR